MNLAKAYKNIRIDELDPSLPGDKEALENLRLFTGFLNENTISKISPPYDVVVSFHILEHQNEPQKFLSMIRKLLGNQGLICIEVPYPFSPFWFRKPIEGYFRTVHPINFTRYSLRYLLQNCGFDPVCDDITSLTMYRILARNNGRKAESDSLSRHAIKRIDWFINAWKVYSRMTSIKYLSLLAGPYAKLYWRLNHNINKL